MEGVIFDLQRFTVHDGPGIRTGVFMKGCPLRCPWCQNPESVRKAPQITYFPNLCIGCGQCVEVCPQMAVRASGKNLIEKVSLTLCNHCGICAESCHAGALQLTGRVMSAEEVCEFVMRDVLYYQNSGGGVTFTGGEPTYQPDFLIEMARLCKKQGLHIVIETCGYFPWDSAAEAFYLTDIVYMDIKHLDSSKHKSVIGAENKIILENALRIDQLNKPIRIRVPLIPGFNDSTAAFGPILRFASGLKNLEKVQILPYHRFGVDKYERIGWGYSLQELEPPPKSTVEKLLALAGSQNVNCSL